MRPPLSALVMMCLALVLATGCQRTVTPVVAPPPGEIESLRKNLQIVADSGYGGSSLQGVQIGIEELDPSFPKKKELEELYPKLSAAAEGEAVKKVARQMLDVIETGAPTKE